MVRILFPPPLSLRTSVPLDRLDPASLPSAIRGTVDKFGRLDVLHNNAGGSNAQGLIDKPAGSLLSCRHPASRSMFEQRWARSPRPPVETKA